MFTRICRKLRRGRACGTARGDRGQSLLEYSITVAIVAAAFVGMSMYVQRAVQGRIYAFDDEISAKPEEDTSWWGFGGSGGGVALW